MENVSNEKGKNEKIKKKNYIKILVILVIVFSFFIILISRSDKFSSQLFCGSPEESFFLYCSANKYEGRYFCTPPNIKCEKMAMEYCNQMGFKHYKPILPEKYSSDFTCYKIEDENKKCQDGKDCDSGYCIPNDINCKGNCFGKCWGKITSPGSQYETDYNKKYYILVDGKVKEDLNRWQ